MKQTELFNETVLHTLWGYSTVGCYTLFCPAVNEHMCACVYATFSVHEHMCARVYATLSVQQMDKTFTHACIGDHSDCCVE